MATAEAHGVSQRFAPGAEFAADWWTVFHSPAVQGVVEEAIAHNPGLEAADAALRQSQNELRAGYGVFYPNATAGASATRQRYSPVAVGERAPASIFNLFTLSASVSYALDVFGGQRRAVEALGAQVDLQRATERGVYLTLIANVVNTLVACAAYRDEIIATRELIELLRHQVRLAQAQVSAGTVPYSTLLSLKSQLASVEAQIPLLERQLAQSEDLLATLVGRAPSDWRAPPLDLASFTLPADLPETLPSDLVRRRPDILAAESAAHAASAGVGVATAALFPSVTLSGAYSSNAATTNALSSELGRSWSGGAALRQPLFEGGTLWFQRKAAIDAFDRAMAQYRATVIGAFAQVADALQGLQFDAAALAARDEALASARDALRLIHVNYDAGLANYLDVLNADVQYHQAQIGELESIAVRLQDTAALYVALGGGWWQDSGPSQRR